MGILKSKKVAVPDVATTNKRRSAPTDFANLKPLQPGGTIGFTGVRDDPSPRRRNGKSRSVDDMDSDDDEDEAKTAAGKESKLVDAEGDDFKNQNLSPEDAKKQGELADGGEED